MIKDMDMLGALVVLSCYLFLIPEFSMLPLAIFPYFFGIAVSTIGLSRQASQKLTGTYLGLAVLVIFSIFLLLGIFGEAALVVIYVTPSAVAFSSLIIASRAKDNKPVQIEREGAPF